jgi:hypothetical protein
MASVFISYQHGDAEFTLHLYDDLKAASLDPWIDQRNIGTGQWDRQVEKALKESPAMILILTPRSAESENVADEWSYFLDNKKPILPILLEQCEIPFRLRRLQYIDFTKDYQSAFAALLRELQRIGLNDQGSSYVPQTIPPTTITPTSAPGGVPIPTLQRMLVQPSELMMFSGAFPEMMQFNYVVTGGSDPNAFAQSWTAASCFNLAKIVPTTLTKLRWFGCADINFSPLNFCASFGYLRLMDYQIHEFGDESSPNRWITDPDVRSAYTTDGVFMQIEHPHQSFPNALFGSGFQGRLCPGLALVNGELWVPYKRFLLQARVLCLQGTNNYIWNLKSAAINAMQARIAAFGL